MEIIYGSGTGKRYMDYIKTSKPVIIQIGAHDGVVGEEYGFIEWLSTLPDFKLYLIEPIEKHFNKLQNVYSQFGDKVVYCNFAITESNTQYNMSDNEGMSKIDNNGPLVIQGKTFETFVSEYNIDTIDALFLDCEGYEYKILKQIDLKKFRPTSIRYEFFWIDEKVLCDGYLIESGYEICGCYFDDLYNKLAYLGDCIGL